MKVSRIEIKDFQQFKDFQVDLTYPKGHEKAGEPLDKVCFIGQSGTGKTILLEFLREGSLNYNNKFSFSQHPRISKGQVNISLTHNRNNYLKQLGRNGVSGIAVEDRTKLTEGFENWIDEGERKVFYFPFGLNAQTRNLDKDLELDEFEPIVTTYQNETYYEFDYTTILNTWKNIYTAILEYKNQEANFRLEATARLEKENFNFKNALEEWRSKNPNPLKDIADNCLNKILNQIHLKVKTEIGAINRLNHIEIEKLNGTQTIDYEQLSTGTRQFIFTALPLYLLDSKDAIILIDEPETSLYPDIQRQIVPTYSDLAPEAQFFYATHSPVILSSFEPWEIVVLEFDKDGFVQPKKMYKGERHVDNYMANPRYLRWDDILTTYLGLDEEGSEERIEMLQELSILGNKLKHLNGGNDKLKQELWKAYKEKATKLGWSTIHEK